MVFPGRFIHNENDMERLELFLRSDALADEEAIEPLLETAELTRQLISAQAYDDLAEFIRYTIQKEYYEAFSWILEVVQEEYDRADTSVPAEAACDLGGSIRNYDEFAARLRFDPEVLQNGFEKVYDEHREVDSFFNISVHRTAYSHIYLITEENFDTRDNDFIRYRLLFRKEPWYP